jgi:uncharacterized RDD family membrane protein YckC
VQEAVVAIFGDVDIESGGEVKEATVAIFGDIRAAKGAILHGETVAVGGKVEAAEGATIEGSPVQLVIPKWLKTWFLECVLKMRPLAPKVGWVWSIAAGFFLFYLLIAVVVPQPVRACVDELTRRPATSFLFGLLTKLLVPMVLVLLVATGIGVFVVPFLWAALVIGAIVGKVALLEVCGLGLVRQFGATTWQKPVIGFLLGTIIVTLLYMVPVVGLLTFGILSIWGLGAAVTAAFGSLRREVQPKPASTPPSPVMAAATTSGTASPENPALTPTNQTQTAPVVPPVVPEILSYPRAGFWSRMAAGFLDMILVVILGKVVNGPPLAFLVALAYFAGIWTWRGTSIGGIVLGLKVVRHDGQPVSFMVALVRALAAAFSIVVLFLGFIWIAWDKDKQGWHDKIAGTVVLRLPRGTPLVCL